MIIRISYLSRYMLLVNKCVNLCREKLNLLSDIRTEEVYLNFKQFFWISWLFNIFVSIICWATQIMLLHEVFASVFTIFNFLYLDTRAHSRCTRILLLFASFVWAVLYLLLRNIKLSVKEKTVILFICTFQMLLDKKNFD